MEIQIGFKDDDFMYGRLSVFIDGNHNVIQLNKPKSLINVSNDLYIRFELSKIIKKYTR